jgi:phytoene dehydrogenase-like protein
MAKKSSTGALTQEQKDVQDARYAQGHEYDYVFIGTGHSALVTASLLANAGNKVCMLEYHDVAGGYAHTFTAGEYSFCAQIHYTWSCGEGGKMWHFLKKLGLEKEVTWNLYDPEGYDHMVMPDGKRVRIPYGWDKLAENIDEAYPGQKPHVQKFTTILDTLRREMGYLPHGKDTRWWTYVLRAPHMLHLIKYRKATLQDVFDECGLSKEAQAVLIANAGDLGEPPKRLSIFMYAGLFGGYNTGAYYPTKHFKGYIDALVGSIEKHGGHVYYESEVTKISEENGMIGSVETHDGKVFTAKKGFVCNMDPQTVAKKLIGWDKFPKKFQKQLTYEYSFSGIMMYLGIEGIDLREYGFGKFNIWHMESWDMNEMWDKSANLDFDKTWWFMSTPSLHSDEPGTTPPGGQILEIATFVSYDQFKKAQEKGYAEYMKMKLQISNMLIKRIEEKYIPNLSKHIKVKQIGTPTTNEDFVMAPMGNAYGSAMTPQNVGPGRLQAWTPFPNFFWCNASSGFAGIAGTLHGGMQLYMDLTGDEFYTKEDVLSDDELIARLPKV